MLPWKSFFCLNVVLSLTQNKYQQKGLRDTFANHTDLTLIDCLILSLQLFDQYMHIALSIKIQLKNLFCYRHYLNKRHDHGNKWSDPVRYGKDNIITINIKLLTRKKGFFPRTWHPTLRNQIWLTLFPVYGKVQSTVWATYLTVILAIKSIQQAAHFWTILYIVMGLLQVSIYTCM